MSKGSRRERELVELYQRAGYATYRPATVQYGENDVFGLFDVLAVSPRDESVHAVQVKSNNATGLMAWKEHTRLWRSLGWLTLYAVPVDRQGWVIYDAGCEPVDGRRACRVEIDERELDCSVGDAVVDWLRSQRAE